MPRIRIAWLMVFVAIVAINIATVTRVDYNNTFKELVLMGALPMANTLVVGLLMGYWSRRSRRFLLGFEAFGLTVLSLFVAGIRLFPEMINLHYRLVIKPYGRSLTMISITMVVTGLTHLAFALLGGFLSHKLGNLRTDRSDSWLMTK